MPTEEPFCFFQFPISSNWFICPTEVVNDYESSIPRDDNILIDRDRELDPPDYLEQLQRQKIYASVSLVIFSSIDGNRNQTVEGTLNLVEFVRKYTAKQADNPFQLEFR